MNEENSLKPGRATLMFSVVSLLLAACTQPDGKDQIQPTTTVGLTATTTASSGGPIPVIVDYSPTVSDVGGLLYLLSHPGVEVVAISLPVTGEAGCDLGMEVTMGILAMMRREDISVACGSDAGAGAKSWPEEFLTGHENLTFGLSAGLVSSYEGTASQLISETVAGSEQPVTVWAVGPLTNLATALEQDPEIVPGIEMVVVMGGAVDVPGNVFDSAAEWNLYIDPAAAAEVIASGVPVTLVPLDATGDVPVPAWYPTALKEAAQSDQIVHLGYMVRLFPAVTSGFYYFWDELAAAVVAESVKVSTETASISVIDNGTDQGRTVRDPAGTVITIATGVVDPEAFYLEFISTLAGSQYQRPVAGAAETEYLASLQGSIAQLETLFAELFSDPTFDPAQPYNPPQVAAGIDRILEVFESSLPVVEARQLPDSLAAEHNAYFDELRSMVEARGSVVEGLGNVTTWDEASSLLDQLTASTACLAMVNKAAAIGVEVELFCVE